MKLFIKTIATLSIILIKLNGYSQYFDQTSTLYHNASTTLAYSNDIAETIDPSGVFTVGEDSKETSLQDLYIKTSRMSVHYVNPTYREYVKKVLTKGTNLYIICDAINISTNKSYLMVLKYNTATLSLLNTSISKTLSAPVDACLDVSGNVFVACYKNTGNSRALAITKLNSTSLVVIRTYEYYNQSATDLIQENPKDIHYNFFDNSIYLAGGIINGTLSSTLLIKLDAATNTETWKKISNLAAGKNVYNAVNTSSDRVYVTGARTDALGKTYMQIHTYSYAGSSPYDYTYYGISSQETEGLKITFAASFQVNVIGSTKDIINNKFKIVIGCLSATLSTPLTFYTEDLPLNSFIGDAITNQQSLYTLITGTKQVGSTQNMFLYGYDVSKFSIILDYSDAIVNRSAGGNSIAFPNVGFAYVAGYQDTRPNAFQPHDYQYFTRTYWSDVIGFHKKSSVENSSEAKVAKTADITIFPNPVTTGRFTVQSKELINAWSLFDVNGAMLLSKATNKLSVSIDISSLPAGMYFLKINDGIAQKIVKQ